jgi:hypothetical protein
MKFSCTIIRRRNGDWAVRHIGSQVGTVEVTAGSRLEALEKMRREILYRLELCPCTGEMYQHTDIPVAPINARLADPRGASN